MIKPDKCDPFALFKLVWPHLRLYDKQREILRSVWDNEETIVVAGHKLGKDFISAVVAILFFRSRSPCRVITTSVSGVQLEDVLWGEIRWLLSEAKIDLGLQYNHLHLRQKLQNGKYQDKSELRGKTVAVGESLAGYHLPFDVPRTLAIFDESSAISDETYRSTLGWTTRRLIIGNPYPCNNFFKRAVKKGDVKRRDGNGYLKKVITVSAEDSPNVRRSQWELENKKPVSNKILIPGVISYDEMQNRLLTWDPDAIEAGIYGRFYEGEELKLFPESWFESQLDHYKSNYSKAYSIGVDVAEGGDNTCICVVGENQLIELQSRKTPDTSIIPDLIIETLTRYNVSADNVWIDQGGGGKEHADILRRMGYNVNLVFFGEAATRVNNQRKWKSRQEKLDARESRTTYKNRRVELYHNASQRINPAYHQFGLPDGEDGKQYRELYRQLAAMPKQTDGEGKYVLPPKNHTNRNQQSLVSILGNSPDEADAFVLALWGLSKEEEEIVI